MVLGWFNFNWLLPWSHRILWYLWRWLSIQGSDYVVRKGHFIQRLLGNWNSLESNDSAWGPVETIAFNVEDGKIIYFTLFTERFMHKLSLFPYSTPDQLKGKPILRPPHNIPSMNSDSYFNLEQDVENVLEFCRIIQLRKLFAWLGGEYNFHFNEISVKYCFGSMQLLRFIWPLLLYCGGSGFERSYI